MSGYIAELYGFRADDVSDVSLQHAQGRICPVTNSLCAKKLSRDNTPSGVCAIKQMKIDSPEIICCPIRLYAEDYKLLKLVARDAFKGDFPLCAGNSAVGYALENKKETVAVFGHDWGGELRLPKREGVGSYFVDWVLAKLNENGQLTEFTAIEIQTIDTTGSYRDAQQALVNDRSIVKDSVGLNWENVSKRIIPQIIYKGQVLQREELCRTGLYFICPTPVYQNVLKRLGGKDKLMKFPSQPASIHFWAYDYDQTEMKTDGKMRSLTFIEEHCTTVYKVQEAFSAVDLPDGNVYRDAIIHALYD